MAKIKRKKFRTLMELRYNGVTFTIHHLVLAKSLQTQKLLFYKMVEKLDKLNVDILSFDETSLEIENLHLSEEDKNRINDLIKITSRFFPSNDAFVEDNAIETYQHGKITQISDQANSLFVNIIILTSTLIEALVNSYIFIKCWETDEKNILQLFESIKSKFDENQTKNLEANKESVVKFLEFVEICKKWQVVPELFLKDYEMSFGRLPGQNLKELVKFRNSLVHYKPKVSDGSQELKGNSFYNIEDYEVKKKNIRNFLELPKDLLLHLYKHGESAGLIIKLSDSILLSDQDKNAILGTQIISKT